jgi:hypothetical protein
LSIWRARSRRAIIDRDRLLYQEIHGWLLYPWHWVFWPRETRSEGAGWPRWVRVEWFCLRFEWRFEIPTPAQLAKFTEEEQ